MAMRPTTSVVPMTNYNVTFTVVLESGPSPDQSKIIDDGFKKLQVAKVRALTNNRYDGQISVDSSSEKDACDDVRNLLGRILLDASYTKETAPISNVFTV